jgi:hypothetical protein
VRLFAADIAGVFTEWTLFFVFELTCLEVLAYQQAGAADQ